MFHHGEAKLVDLAARTKRSYKASVAKNPVQSLVPGSDMKAPVTPPLSAPLTAVGQQRATVQLAEVPHWLELWKATADSVQSTLTILAIIGGAVWFLRRRQRFPRANISHAVTGWRVGDKTLLHVGVKITNIGEVMLRLRKFNIRIQQLLPNDLEVTSAMQDYSKLDTSAASEIDWPGLD